MPTSRAWAKKVWARDTSLFRCGVVEASWVISAVTSVGRVRERLRFKTLCPEDGAPRERALELLLDRAGDGLGNQLGRQCGFLEVPASLLLQSQWRVVCSRCL